MGRLFLLLSRSDRRYDHVDGAGVLRWHRKLRLGVRPAVGTASGNAIRRKFNRAAWPGVHHRYDFWNLQFGIGVLRSRRRFCKALNRKRESGRDREFSYLHRSDSRYSGPRHNECVGWFGQRIDHESGRPNSNRYGDFGYWFRLWNADSYASGNRNSNRNTNTHADSDSNADRWNTGHSSERSEFHQINFGPNDLPDIGGDDLLHAQRHRSDHEFD
jgi:hypothetical protein